MPTSGVMVKLRGIGRGAPLIAAVFATLLTSGCYRRAPVLGLDVASTPRGAAVTVAVRGERTSRKGELFAADEAGVYVLSGRLVRIYWPAISRFSVPTLPSEYSLYGGRSVSLEVKRRLTHISRFPQGLSPELLTQVLAILSQEKLDVIGDSLGATPSAVDTSEAAGHVHVATVASPSLAALATESANHAHRFAEPRHAAAAGYRRVGTDFPGMGEHWLSTAALFSERLDPRLPTILAYARLDGERQLIGVGYVVTTRDGEPEPSVPGWPEAWHEHSGALFEENGVPSVRARDRRGGTRVWVLHVWTPLENPLGAFDPDNWALPFARRGLGPPANLDADVGRAFSLGVGGEEFLRGLLTGAELLRPENAAATETAVQGAVRAVEHVAARSGEHGTVSPEDAQRLREIWAELTAALHESIGPDVLPLLRPPHATAVSARTVAP